MVNVNLLPWREKQARYEKQIVFYMIGGATLCAWMMIIGCDQYLSSQQQTASENIEKLKKELIWREGLVHHTNHQQVSLPQENSIQFFQRLNEVNAQDVCFDQIKKTKSGIELMGVSNSSEQLTEFLKNASFTKNFSELNVNQIQQQHGGHLKFHIVGKSHVV